MVGELYNAAFDWHVVKGDTGELFAITDQGRVFTITHTVGGTPHTIVLSRSIMVDLVATFLYVIEPSAEQSDVEPNR